MTPARRRLLILCGVVALSACTFRAPQLESVASLARTIVAANQAAEDVVWLASFSGKGAVLKPYVVQGLTVFANESGDAVTFDGWVIRSVIGFGREHPVTIADEGWLRSLKSKDARFAALCSEWQKTTADGGYQWRQICGTNGHETVIDIDEAGRIISIRQSLGGGLGEVLLSARQ